MRIALNVLRNIPWDAPVMVLLLFTGIWFFIRLGCFPIRYGKRIVSDVFRKKKSSGQSGISARQALLTALQFGVDCRIKWVNDLYRADRKVAGILTEGGLLTDGSYSYAVVGIGFNLCVPPKLPAELRDIVGGLFDEPVIEQQRHAFLKSFLSRFAAYYETLPEISFREAYCKRLNVFGRAVSFWHGGVQRTGIAEAIDPQFRLLVRSGEELVPLERGEVTFL